MRGSLIGRASKHDILFVTHPQIHPDTDVDEDRQMRDPPTIPRVYELARLSEPYYPDKAEGVEGQPDVMVVRTDWYRQVYDLLGRFRNQLQFQ